MAPRQFNGVTLVKTRRRSIRLFDHERRLLVEMYLRRRIPIEQYESRSADLADLVEEWYRLTRRRDTGGELIHYMRTQRKQGQWVRFGGNHQTAPPLPELSAEEIEILVDIYYENVTVLGNGSDVLAYEDETKLFIAREFADQAGRIVAADDLVAKLTAIRKRGLLPKVRDHKKPDGAGFSDIDEVDDRDQAAG